MRVVHLLSQASCSSFLCGIKCAFACRQDSCKLHLPRRELSTKKAALELLLEPKEDAVVRQTNYYTEVNTVTFKDSTTSKVPQVKLKTLDAPGCPYEFVKERQEDSLTIAQLRSRSTNKDCFGKIGCGNDELIHNDDLKDVRE
ncbi:hypothetical protein POM88_051751 [Heracleum sosnowskyi]|uniref:Uncharacterized protein n=1 Tax=Heracleum sosnowskyi TaxID=360622 RepID=A0AAD8H2K6_9APIA|nr:hypothetical protein POM88_051751 [Heracleum sosnowskyi]